MQDELQGLACRLSAPMAVHKDIHGSGVVEHHTPTHTIPHPNESLSPSHHHPAVFNVRLDLVNMFYVLRRAKELAKMNFVSKAANGGGLESMLASGMQYLKMLAKQVSALGKSAERPTTWHSALNAVSVKIDCQPPCFDLCLEAPLTLLSISLS